MTATASITIDETNIIIQATITYGIGGGIRQIYQITSSLATQIGITTTEHVASSIIIKTDTTKNIISSLTCQSYFLLSYPNEPTNIVAKSLINGVIHKEDVNAIIYTFAYEQYTAKYISDLII